jgi:hypothetical protein
MTKPSGGAAIDRAAAAKEAVVGDAREKGEESSPDDRESGEASPADDCTAHDRAS